MSREIKFRAWDGVLDKYVYWKDLLLDNVFISILYDKNYDVEQYTGLKDKNGIEIYEGDIIRIEQEYELNHWNETGQVIQVRYEDSGFTPFSEYDSDCGTQLIAKECTIIGNIHQNPELLEANN